MIPIQFDYTAPKSLDEAVALMRQNDNARPLAGGHELLLRLRSRQVTPNLLVDLRHISSLRGIGRRPGDDGLYIGAMESCAEVAAHPDIQANCKALVEAANSIGDAQVRNCATIGGNLAGGDPAADLAAAVLALTAALHSIGPYGSRVIGADEFFVAPFKTALAAGEIITAVKFPLAPARSGSAYEKIKNPASAYPLCGVAAAVTLTAEGLVARCRVAVTGAATHPVRLHEVETALEKANPTADAIAAAARRASKGLTFVSDLAASDEYRAHLSVVLAERAVARAVERARA